MANDTLTYSTALVGDAALERLLRLLRTEGDEAFLRGAYQLVIGRGIDGDGQRFYEQRIQQGMRRSELVWELASSDEGRAHLAHDPPLWHAITRVAGRQRAPAATVAHLLALPDAGFAEACVELFAGRVPPSQMRQRLQTALASGQPRYRLLLALATDSGRNAFPDMQGLDAFLARARDAMFPVAASMHEMLAYEDDAFVDCAYKTLLGRAPDTAGAAYYLGRLRAGYSRTSVIEGLARSAEARLRQAAPAGLRSLCLRYQLCRVLLHARWAAWLLRVESDRAAERQRRQLGGLSRRISGLEMRLLDGPAAPADQPPAGGRIGLDAEALLDIQRDNFERETAALRKLAVQLLDAAEAPGPPARRPLRRRRAAGC